MLREVLSKLSPEERALWWERLAVAIAQLDPAQTGELRRSLSHLAFELKAVGGAWALLWPLVDCAGCPEHDRRDALRVLDQFLPDDHVERRRVSERTEAEAWAILNGPPCADAHVPLVWSAFQRMRREGRLAEAVTMQRAKLDRVGQHQAADSLAGSRENLAYDLVALGRRDEARVEWMKVEAFYRAQDAANGGTLSLDRARVLAHAAASFDEADAVALLSGSLAESGAQGAAGAAVIGLHLLVAHQRAGRRAEVITTAQRVWDVLRAGRDAPPALPAGHAAECAAMVCSHAADAAGAAGQPQQQALWLARLEALAPNTITAQTMRDRAERERLERAIGR
jgi:hypothetical protein